MSENKPLAGIKVVEWTTFVAAPVCGRIMADWGADVTKIETPDGDYWRTYGPKMDVPGEDGENPLFDLTNANKKAVTLNLRTPGGKEIMEKMIAGCDVFITNSRTKVLKKLGFDYESIKAKYPHVIFATITGYGDEGPDANRPGFDIVSFWAHGGFMADMRVADGRSEPINSPGAMGDISTGSMLFGAVMGALYARSKTGRGDKVSVSLYGGAVWTMGVMVTAAQKKYGYKYPRERELCKPSAATYKCKDGEYISIAAAQYERDFPKVCAVLGIPEVAQLPEYKDYDTMALDENRVPMLHRFEEIFLTKTAAEWDKLLTEQDLPHDVLAHFKNITDDEQARVNHFVEQVTFRNGEQAWLPRPCMVSENLGLPEYRLAPLLGEHSEQVLAELGYSQEQIAQFEQDGAIFAAK